jgi:hypothetical protein
VLRGDDSGKRSDQAANCFAKPINYFLALNFAQRAFAAAAIRALPAALIRRRLRATGATSIPFTFAQRAFCASPIFRRAEADIRRLPRLIGSPTAPLPFSPPNASNSVCRVSICSLREMIRRKSADE